MPVPPVTTISFLPKAKEVPDIMASCCVTEERTRSEEIGSTVLINFEFWDICYIQFAVSGRSFGPERGTVFVYGSLESKLIL